MTTIAEVALWGSAALVLYSYAGYPLLLWVIDLVRNSAAVIPMTAWPSVTMVVPAHNERAHIPAKVKNTLALSYPGRLQILFVSDGSTDGTADAIRKHAGNRAELLDLPVRRGKAAALNAALERARHEIIVFSDASIVLEPESLQRVVEPFADRTVGCVSGEDHIAGSGGEALYGRYELFIRRQESQLHSIVGASGCFYAQRRSLCAPFVANLAPDFLSVLRTVEQGYRAISSPEARGAMAAVEHTSDEFQRKVRTLLRGLTTMSAYAGLLNPLRYPVFAFELLSHKVLRWLVPFLLLVCLAASVVLAFDSTAYAALLAAQLAFYVLAAAELAGMRLPVAALPGKAAAYFTLTNVAVLVAWGKYVTGVRQELWAPSQRAHSQSRMSGQESTR